MNINTNYNAGLNYRQQTKPAPAFKGFSDSRGREHFMNDYGVNTGEILEKLSDAYGKDLIYIKKNPLMYNEDLQSELYIVPQGKNLRMLKVRRK